MRSTFKILFYIKRNEPRKDGTVVIMIRITIDGVRAQFSSKHFVRPELWDNKLGKVIGKTAYANNLNRVLNDIHGELNTIYKNLKVIDGYVLPEKLRNIFCGFEEKEKTIISYFDKFIEQYKLKVGTTATHKTYTRYVLTRNRLVEFMKEHYNVPDMPIKEINLAFIDEFYLHIRNNTKCNHNSTLKFLQRFRSVLYYAKNTGLIFHDPFGNFRFRFDKVDRDCLTQEELDTLYNKEFASGRLSQVRDIFLFSCYTGQSYVDIFELTEDKIREAFDGHLWIMNKRQKTNVNSNVRLLDIPLKILAKYKGKQKNGKVLPVISNQKMNDYLKEIGEICGIEKRITFHCARHTFATTIALSNDVPMESVQTMLGHSDIKTTQIYAHVVDTKLSRDMERMATRVNSREPKNERNSLSPQIKLKQQEKSKDPVILSKETNNTIDEAFFIGRHTNLREITDRDYYFSIVESGYQTVYTSASIRIITNGTDFIIGSKSFGNILGGFYTLDFGTGCYEDFKYGKASLINLEPAAQFPAQTSLRKKVTNL